VSDTEVRDLIRENRDTWRKMRDEIKRRPKPWTVDVACRYESYGLVEMVLDELLELTEDQ
jgi:hypothetical protein